jgi:phosphoglycolate phosphatase
VKIRLACVDMAGTVMLDGGLVLEAFRAALTGAGVEGPAFGPAMDYAHETMGLSKSVVFRHILGSEELVDLALSEFDSAIDAAIKEGRVTEIPGATDTMAAIRAAGIKVCLTTGFSAEVQRAVIDHLGWEDVTDFFIAPSETVRGRPFPDMVLTAALKAQVDDVREVAVVGDTANDLWSGHRAGASVVAGVLTGSHNRLELEAAPHTDILASILDFPALLSARS